MAIGTMTGQLLCYDWRSLKAPLSTIIPHTKAVRSVAFQIDYTREFREDGALQDTATSSYIESSSFSDMESSPEEVKVVENKIPSGIEVNPDNSKEAFKKVVEKELEQVLWPLESFFNTQFIYLTGQG